MTFRKHYTEKDKEDRRLRYRMLRNAGIDSQKARIFRDWTDNKIFMICLGEADPIR